MLYTFYYKARTFCQQKKSITRIASIDSSILHLNLKYYQHTTNQTDPYCCLSYQIHNYHVRQIVNNIRGVSTMIYDGIP